MNHASYKRLALMALLSFLSMYVLMYAMVDVFGNVYANLNQFYMAGMMTAPMVILELILMKPMYERGRRNILIISVSALFLALCWAGIRQQAAIADEQFLKSMIPHHAAAILMCEEAPLEDPDIQELCQNIISGQQAEIDFMKAKLNSNK